MSYPTHPDYINHSSHADHDPDKDINWQPHNPTDLQARHQAAKVRARKIASREPSVISIYDLGAEIAQIEHEAIHQSELENLEIVIHLQRIITRLKSLLPIP
jgi:hypothetical protein